MYNSYFGFREKPFKLVPNPDYLFLSKSHEVSLAHLTYATDQGDGFVVITGEVGTGKTTLCRIFLERLDNETESAYIFNPKLDSVELLTSICNEFGIHTQLPTVKGLLDVLNNYLIAKNKEGRKVILLIDEAQNLTIENLEMVRMLSNLETTRSKLLQIVLVGQPELSDKLDSHELRQLSQRISLSCHLTPLSAKETEGYIGHRINIAAQRSLELFTTGACRKIYQYTAGIPRLINIACDRALLSAYSLNRKKVTAAIAATAIRELSNRGQAPRTGFGWRNAAWVALACLVSLAIGVWIMKSDVRARKKTPAASIDTHHEKAAVATPSGQAFKIPDSPNMETQDATPADTPEASAQTLPQADPEMLQGAGASFQEEINRLEPDQSRLDAVANLLALWRQPKPNAGQLPAQMDDTDYFDIAARQYGLRVQQIQGDWNLIKRINLPCILSLQRKGRIRPVYMTLMHWKGDRLLLAEGSSQKPIETDLEAIKPYLQAGVFLFWKNVTGFDFIIAKGADSNAILTVKSLLQRIGYGPFADSAEYDAKIRKAVLEFQGRSRIDEDGLVGPVTKIMLINAARAYDVPKLVLEEEGTGA